MQKTLTLADELANQSGSAAADDASGVQIGAPAQTSPLISETAAATTGVSIADELAGHAYTTFDLAQVNLVETAPPYASVTSEAQYFGTTAGQRGGYGLDIAFANPAADGATGYESVEVFGYKTTNGYTNIGAYDILGWNQSATTGSNIILATGYNGPGNGYSTVLELHDSTLKPGTTNQTFPFTFSDANSADAGSVNPALPPAATGLPAVPCYLAGTRVATERGMKTVESLKVGDLIRTVNGAGGLKPVVWIGRRELDASRHPEPTQVAPVRIRAGAFAPQQPVRDLLVSPDHAIYVDGVLVPARLLINGGSIVQDMSVTAIRYFHVELDSHAVMLAEGLPAESYLAGANRGAFANAADPVDLHPTFATDEAAYAAQACATLTVDPAAVLPIWSRLADRGAELGMAASLPASTVEPDVRAVAGERALAPRTEAGRLVFSLPRGTKSVRIVSRGARPADTRPWLDDRRRLGVMVAGLSVETGRGRKDVAMDDPALAEGWWGPEASDVGMVRWTDGDALVTLPRGAKTLEVRLVGEMAYPIDPLAVAA